MNLAEEIFYGLEVSKTDVVMLHGDAAIFAQILGDFSKAKIGNLVDEIIEFFSDEGALLVPVFTYSFAKNEIYDPEMTPSSIGQFSELFRKSPKMVRTNHPMFSVMVGTGLRTEILASSVTDCFGQETFFEELRKHNGKVVTLGCRLNNGLSYLHSIEQKMEVPYRFMKRFEGWCQLNGDTHSMSINYFARRLDLDSELDARKLIALLKSESKLSSTMIGRLQCHAVKTIDLDYYATRILEEDPWGLTRLSSL